MRKKSWIEQQSAKEIENRLYDGSRTKYTINKLKRLVIRSIRVSLGFLLAIVTYIVSREINVGIGDLPVSQITINMITESIFKGVIMISLFLLSWKIAFGDAPNPKK